MEKKFFLTIILSFFMISLFMSCDKSTSLSPSDESSLYEYIAFDSSSTKVAKGWLLLKFEDNVITGQWDIQAVGSPQNIGPQLGSGNLAGNCNSDSIWVDLQPNMQDNNLLLEGRLTDDDYSGTWIYISLTGPTNSGTFTARKIIL